MAKDQKETKAPRELSVKEHIYTRIAEYVKEKTGKRIGRTGGREIFDMAVQDIFASAVREGTLRFNGGFGSLHLRTYGSGKRRLPSGIVTTFGERKKMRYEEGVVGKSLIESGGDLEKAKAARAEDKGSEPDADGKSESKPVAEASASKDAAPASDEAEAVDLD